MAYDADDPTGLVGEKLNTLAFVMDYVEFMFNGPVLRALASPSVQSGEMRFRFPEPGSRDALCSLIGSKVLAITITEGERIEVVVDTGQTLTIPLDDESRVGREAAHYVPAASDGTLRIADMLIW
jgi:hypothetical protein